MKSYELTSSRPSSPRQSLTLFVLVDSYAGHHLFQPKPVEGDALNHISTRFHPMCVTCFKSHSRISLPVDECACVIATHQPSRITFGKLIFGSLKSVIVPWGNLPKPVPILDHADAPASDNQVSPSVPLAVLDAPTCACKQTDDGYTHAYRFGFLIACCPNLPVHHPWSTRTILPNNAS